MTNSFQEQEIDRLRGENRALREDINDLQWHLEKRDRQLAREIRKAVETYEKAIKIYEKVCQDRKPLSAGTGYI